MKYSATIIALAVPMSVIAAKHEHRQHDAHEHGVAQLTLVAESKNLEITMKSPAFNMLGFGNKPETPEQEKIFDFAMADLKNSATLFELSGDARCELITANAEQVFEDEHDDHDHDEHEEHDEHDHDKHEEHDEHDHDKHEEHDEHDHDKHEEHDEHDHDKHEEHDDHDHDESSAGRHSDIEASWQWQCDNLSQLNYVDLAPMFKRFPKLEKINAEWIFNDQQSASALENGRTRIPGE